MNSSRSGRGAEQGEEERLQEDGLVEGTSFRAASELHHLADEDDLADDEGVDDGEAKTATSFIAAVIALAILVANHAGYLSHPVR